MVNEREIPLALTFDDVLLLPARSKVHPSETDLKTRLAPGIGLNIPILSAAMDTVTESRLAISMPPKGGPGVIQKNLKIQAQAAESGRRTRRHSQEPGYRRADGRGGQGETPGDRDHRRRRHVPPDPEDLGSARGH